MEEKISEFIPKYTKKSPYDHLNKLLIDVNVFVIVIFLAILFLILSNAHIM